MVYVALLRGINVGGKNKVEMKRLKQVFEQAGMDSVSTYINSGNVVFNNKSREVDKITRVLETGIEKTFGFNIKVLVRDIENIRTAVRALPDAWQNDDSAKCDVMFLWESAANEKVLEQLTIKPDIDEVKYVAGTILWRVERTKVSRSGLVKLVGTDLYKQMTIRNCNTARKLLALMETMK